MNIMTVQNITFESLRILPFDAKNGLTLMEAEARLRTARKQVRTNRRFFNECEEQIRSKNKLENSLLVI